MVVKWLALPLGFLKLNMNASVVNGKAIGGGMVSDHYRMLSWISIRS